LIPIAHVITALQKQKIPPFVSAEFLHNIFYNEELAMNIFEERGRFFLGCNYWASHAGTAMWSDWNEEIVEEDLRRISASGLTVLRVFPLWSDFQPLTLLLQHNALPREYRFGEQLLPDTEEGKAGISAEAVAHFQVFCDLAHKYGLSLVVGLVTGWMSGRFFAPGPLEGKNVFTDPVALMWEIRFVRYMVRRFKSHPAIAAWDLGNECNCMAPLTSHEQAYTWTALITNTIRSEDKSRPVISGMHGLSPDGIWRMQDQGELLDVLTTHPYPLFTPHADLDPINTMRSGMHATSESLYYSDLGKKPCFVEECGTLGPMFASETIAADYVRNNLFTLWAHDCHGFLWWCANDQKHLTHAPYDWNAVERELGLFRQNGEAKPVVHTMSRFAAFLKDFPHLPLPPRILDGVCLLSRNNDNWGAAYMTFTLAKQAGLDLSFAYIEDGIPESPLYFLPDLCGDAAVSNHRMNELLQKVKNGASLYLSTDGGLLCPFTEFTGLQSQTRCRAKGSETLQFSGEIYSISRHFILNTLPLTARVLASDEGGLPVYTVNDYGKGKVFFLTFSLEQNLISSPGIFAPDAPDYTLFYSMVAEGVSLQKTARSHSRHICVTEHILDENRHLLVVINYLPEPTQAKLSLAIGWTVTESWETESLVAGQKENIHFPISHNTGCVLLIEKN